MGQARLRGTFETRKAQGVERLELERAAAVAARLEAKLAAIETNRVLRDTNPVEYNRMVSNRMRASSLIAAVAGMLVQLPNR